MSLFFIKAMAESEFLICSWDNGFIASSDPSSLTKLIAGICGGVGGLLLLGGLFAAKRYCHRPQANTSSRNPQLISSSSSPVEIALVPLSPQTAVSASSSSSPSLITSETLPRNTRSVTTFSQPSSSSSSTTSQSSTSISTIHAVKQAEQKQEPVNFQEKVKSLLNEDYKFSISQPKMDTLIIQCTSINEVPGSPDTIGEKLNDLIQSLKSAIVEKDIKNDQYEMDIDLEEGKLAIKVIEPKILNRIAELLEKTGRPEGSKGISYFTPPSQVKEALFFGSRKSVPVPSGTSEPEPVSVNCLLQ